MNRSIRGTPVVVQVSGLVLACVLAAQSISLSLVLLAPPPPLSNVVVDDVARAARQGSNDDLTVELMLEPPIGPTLQDPTSTPFLIASSLAEILGKRFEDIHVAIIAETMVRAPVATTGQIVVVPPDPAGPGKQPGSPPPLTELMRNKFLKLPPFMTAIRQDDGSWLVIRPYQAWLSPWQTRILLGFLGTLLLLAPLVWLSSRWLTQSIRVFAVASETFGQDPSAPPLAENKGPSERALAFMTHSSLPESASRRSSSQILWLWCVPPSGDVRCPGNANCLLRVHRHLRRAPS